MNVSDYIKSEHYSYNKIILNKLIAYDLSLNEFILIIYYINTNDNNFIPSELSKKLCLSDVDILNAFNRLSEKKLLQLEAQTDENGMIKETVSLNNFYNLIDLDEQKNNEVEDVEELVLYFSTAINVSDVDKELLRAWLDSGFNSSLIKAAFDEAKYNGVCNFRFIDKILYEWHEKGITTVNEKEKFIEEKASSSSSDKLFDYNWLDE